MIDYGITVDRSDDLQIVDAPTLEDLIINIHCSRRKLPPARHHLCVLSLDCSTASIRHADPTNYRTRITPKLLRLMLWMTPTPLYPSSRAGLVLITRQHRTLWRTTSPRERCVPKIDYRSNADLLRMTVDSVVLRCSAAWAPFWCWG